MQIPNMKLVIEINLNDSSMKDNLQVKESLLSSRLVGQTGNEDYIVGECGILRDCNGNATGSWRVIDNLPCD